MLHIIIGKVSHMNQKIVVVTGSLGLIGYETTLLYLNKGYMVIGIDNNLREKLFNIKTKFSEKLLHLQRKYNGRYFHNNRDIREEYFLKSLFKKHGNAIGVVIHTAAQTSHDWAKKNPLMDYSVNADATLYLLESVRQYTSDAVFIFTSTNKVYGDTPNSLPLLELETRWELPESHRYFLGINESMSIDQSKHSVFGASKVAADIMVQEYGKYFGMKTTVFRGGCLTGPAHSGTKLHGFLAYLIRCIARGDEYTIFGYQGKQVRDNIHSLDLVNAFNEVYKNPRQGEVYNIGGSRHSNTSMLEAIAKAEKILGKKAKYKIVKTARSGDHIWYISDVSKFKSHYPGWNYKYDGDQIIDDICRHGHF